MEILLNLSGFTGVVTAEHVSVVLLFHHTAI